MKHLAILNQPYLNLIINGKKNIESRFTKVRCAPYNSIKNGDFVLLKQSGGMVLGDFTVLKFKEYSDLNNDKIKEIKNNYGLQICADEDFWKSKKDSKYCILIWIYKLNIYKNPFKYPKKDRRAWIIMD